MINKEYGDILTQFKQKMFRDFMKQVYFPCQKAKHDKIVDDKNMPKNIGRVLHSFQQQEVKIWDDPIFDLDVRQTNTKLLVKGGRVQ